MKLSRIRRPGPGLVVAVIALFVACSGSAVAASLITSKQIKDGTIQLKDISRKAQKSLKGQRGLVGPQGPMGLQGASGPQGPQGVQGAPGPVNLTYVNGQPVFPDSTGQWAAVALCPAGKSVIGGGVVSSSEVPGDMQVNSSLPLDSDDDGIADDGWLAFIDVANLSDTPPTGLQAYAICTTATSVVGAKRGAAKIAKR